MIDPGFKPYQCLLQSTWNAGHQEVNKAVHSGFETPRRRHQKSKIGVSVVPQKGLMPSKIFKKKTCWKDVSCTCRIPFTLRPDQSNPLRIYQYANMSRSCSIHVSRGKCRGGGKRNVHNKVYVLLIKPYWCNCILWLLAGKTPFMHLFILSASYSRFRQSLFSVLYSQSGSRCFVGGFSN